MFENMNHKDALIGVGVAVGAAVLVLFMNRNKASGSASGGSDIQGGFTTAPTVFVPTSEYDINYNTYKGAVTTTTNNNNGNTSTTTTYGGISPAAGAHPIKDPQPPVIGTSAPPSPIPVKKPITAPTPAPAPKAPTKLNPKPVASHPAPTIHTTNPVTYVAFGNDYYNSSVWGLSDMYLRNHVTHGEKPTNAQIQTEVNHVASVNHLANPNKIQKGAKLRMN